MAPRAAMALASARRRQGYDQIVRTGWDQEMGRMKGVILKIATFEHCNCACAESAKKVVAELRAENEKLRSAITIEPTLTPAQENELTGPKISAIFPRLEIFKMGWRTAMANAKKICDDYE